MIESTLVHVIIGVPGSESSVNSGDASRAVAMFIVLCLSLGLILVMTMLLFRFQRRSTRRRTEQSGGDDAPVDPWTAAGKRMDESESHPPPPLGGRFSDDPD